MFVGIDWASEEHAVCVVDATGGVLDRFTVAHSAEGFERLVRCLARHADPAGLPVAIERPDGRLVDRLLEAGHPVVPVGTAAIKAWREAEVASGAKSDPGDARVIADYLRLLVDGQEVWRTSGAASQRNAKWQLVKLSLDAYAGQTVRLSFEACDCASNSLVEAVVDDVRVYQVP